MHPELRIYYDGKLDVKATYVPLLKKKMLQGLNDLNDWIVDLQQR